MMSLFLTGTGKKKNLSEKSNKNIEPVGFLLLFKNNKNKNELNK